MRLISVKAENFLALAQADLDLDAPLSVLTGVNGVGKSTVLAAMRMARDMLRAAETEATVDAWADAGHHGSDAFEVRVGLAFDESGERDLLDAFAGAAVLQLLHPLGSSSELRDRARAVTEMIGQDAAAALYRGEVVVRYDKRERTPFAVGWEFKVEDHTAHIGLSGRTANQLWPCALIAARDPQFGARSELAASTNNLTELIRSGEVPVRLEQLATAQFAVAFAVARTNATRELDDIRKVLSATSNGSRSIHQLLNHDRATFANVLDALVANRLVVTDNHRVAARVEYTVPDLSPPIDLTDGSRIPAELFAMKNGGASDRARFAAAQDRFNRLIDRHVDITVSQALAKATNLESAGTAPMLRVEPRISDQSDRDGYPLRRVGAGSAEALFLATVLADSRRVVCLDEPGVHLSSTGQRRLLSSLTESDTAQVVLVTHNPDLVPAMTRHEVGSIVRLTSRHGDVHAGRLSEATLDELPRVWARLQYHELRAVLFAQGVVLLEGEHDLALVSTWAERLGVEDRRMSPERNNFVLLPVGGDTSFGPIVQLLHEFAIPFAAITDGPALRPEGKLQRALARLDHPEPGSDNFDDVRASWAKVGIHTLADNFGTDGTKTGEIEAYLTRIDHHAFEKARAEVGRTKDTQVVRRFAAAVAPPEDFRAVWRAIVERLTT